MNFKHSKESESLEGFEKKFYDAIVELTTVLCDGTKAKPDVVTIAYDGDDSNILVITAIVKTRDAEVTDDYLENYGSILCSHFPVFFTPAHYRPYVKVMAVVRCRGQVEIIGSYKDGV